MITERNNSILKRRNFENSNSGRSFNDCGVSIDCDDLLFAYQKKFDVDMSEYL
jgi:hypothetical protein